jgi:ATP-dependent HslUV protease subunit HslV
VALIGRARRSRRRRPSRHTALDARGIAEQAMHIAAAICIYSNDNLTIEVL